MSEMIDRLIAALADSYTVQRMLGQGGMATVYLADDLKHRRKVAVKVLLPELAALIGAERFLREIEIAANLTHPHILPLHDSGQADGFLYYVMPYVEGESLRERLNREEQLSIEDACQLAREVADGLAHAHARGVIHRDIKPENILLSSGHALIADFGIARAVTAAGGQRLTETGLSLGTPQYMSPEQASGSASVDARSDVYALGCLVYEMLVGEPPHTGPNAQAIIAKVLTSPVANVSAARDTVPPAVDAAVAKALAKLPADRFATAQQFGDAMLSALTPGAGVVTPVTTVVTEGRARTWKYLLPWSVAAALGVVLAVLLLSGGRSVAAPGGVTRLTLDPTPATEVSIGAVASAGGAEARAIAISRDGSRIAFVGRESGEGSSMIFVRDLDRSDARPLAETESASSLFFSPDAEWVGFYSWRDRRLKRVSVAGGSPQIICECEPVLSGSWGPDDMVVLDSDGAGGLRLVSASGGAPEEITFRDRHFEDDEYAHNFPSFLPGGRHILFTAWGGAAATRRIAVLSLESGERTTLIDEGWGGVYTASGHLVYQRMNQLWAVPLDAARLEIEGTPVPVVDSVFSAPFVTLFAVADNGTLIYGPGPVPDVRTSLHWITRSGDLERIPMEAGSWSWWGPRVSPDGGRIAFWGADASSMSTGQGSAVIWIYELQQRTLRPLTDVGGTGAFWPVWSEDGQSVVFSAFGAGGRTHVFRVGVEGNAAPDLLLGGDRDAQPYSWLPDGAALAFQQEGDADSGWDVWLLPLTGDSTPTPLIKGSANETHPAFSPDGRWLAYASDETGRYEVYVRRYPELDRPRRVSASGGMGPVWRGDGSELFYHTGSFQDPAGTAFMTVPFDDGPGEPRQIAWFNGIHGVGLPYGRGFDVTPDGQRLLVSVNEQEISLFLPNLEIVINWFDELALKFRK